MVFRLSILFAGKEAPCYNKAMPDMGIRKKGSASQMKSVQKWGKGLAAAIMGAALLGGACGMSTASAEAVLGGEEGHAYHVRRGMYEKEGGSDTQVRRGKYQQERENAPNGDAPQDAQAKPQGDAPQGDVPQGEEAKPQGEQARPQGDAAQGEPGMPAQEASEQGSKEQQAKEPREYKYNVRRGQYEQPGGSDTEVRRGLYEQNDGREHGHL